MLSRLSLGNGSFRNLATVSPDKLEADRSSSTGDFAVFRYFNEEEKRACKVVTDADHAWIYSESKESLVDKKYMYIVDSQGSFHVFNATVHSQVNAGAPVMCAGWIDYVRENPSNRVVDNCSGHYTPTLSQFINTLSIFIYEWIFIVSFFYRT